MYDIWKELPKEDKRAEIAKDKEYEKLITRIRPNVNYYN